MNKIFEISAGGATPIHLVPEERSVDIAGRLSKTAAAYANSVKFSGESGEVILAPSPSGKIATILLGTGDGDDPFICGRLSTALPNGIYQVVEFGGMDPNLATLAIGLGCYRYDRYRKPDEKIRRPRFVWPKECDRQEVERILKGVFLARDLINTPAAQMGPQDLADAGRSLAKEFGAKIVVTEGEHLLVKNLPMIHAVGRASSRPPCLIDLTWGDPSAPKVTLVGKGVCFDTGGLNLKRENMMRLMKKDMGGGANVLGLASIIMARELNLRLRVLIPAVENSVAGEAYRPGDVLTSRKGLTIEIGNTDAEGRLILADALALGDEEAPDIMIDMATLTGGARVALGPDLPSFFCDDEEFTNQVLQAGSRVADPIWRMPLWKPYAESTKSYIADLDNTAPPGTAGSVIAALILQKFVGAAKVWAHIDFYAWNATSRPSRPIGGEAYVIRALYEVLKARYG